MSLQPLAVHPSGEKTFLYATLADSLENQIRNGSFCAGERLPSIRQLHCDTGLSISTVYHAFMELEKRGIIEAREKSGYYVKPLLENILPAPQARRPSWKPVKVSVNNLVFALCDAMANPDMLQLGGALIAPELLPGKELAGLLKRLSNKALQTCFAAYDHYLGLYALRRQLAARMAHPTMRASAEDIVITNGCIEAVSLCLQAVARAGDTILVESPTFPWFLQIIEDFGMFALEIPSSAQDGIDVDLVAQAVERHQVAACIFNANFNNPQGYVMPDERKSALVDLLIRRNIPIIEDDIYGELYFDTARPTPLKTFDTKGMVLYCSSFSKTLSPGLRIGWTLPGRFLEKVSRLKMNHSISQPSLTQFVAARYLKDNLYDRHLRKLRTCLKNQVSNTIRAVARTFPADTQITVPRGGLTSWLQLPAKVDSLELFHRALAAGIVVLPGIICASTNNYGNYIRISCGQPWSERLEKGIELLADIVHKLG